MEEERKDSGVGVVEPKSLQLKLPEGGFKLRTGGVLKRIDVAYEECGAIIFILCYLVLLVILVFMFNNYQ